MDTRGIVQYEPLALSATTVPSGFSHFMRQRSRWARGMFEGIRANPPQHQPRVIAKVVAGIDYLVPFLDIGYVFFWIPGLILALLGYPLIVSWWSMLLHPHHPRRLQHAPPLARTPRLQASTRSTSHRPAWLLRLPLRLPGAHLRRLPPRLHPVPPRRQPSLEVTGRSGYQRAEPFGRCRLALPLDLLAWSADARLMPLLALTRRPVLASVVAGLGIGGRGLWGVERAGRRQRAAIVGHERITAPVVTKHHHRRGHQHHHRKAKSHGHHNKDRTLRDHLFQVPAVDVPNRNLTPGVALHVSVSQICTSGYASRTRDVPQSEKDAVYTRYGVAYVPYAHEVDHLVSLEIGGSNVITNLWPEPYAGRWGARTKDVLENRLHELVCAGRLSLHSAQHQEATNWVARIRAVCR